MAIRCRIRRLVDVLELGTAERIDAVVEMKNPGVWILGTPKDDDRKNGMGIVVEYANQSGAPRWIKPAKKAWDYTLFGDGRTAPDAGRDDPAGIRQDQRRHGRLQPLDRSTARASTRRTEPRVLQKGKRYRLVFDNQTDDAHPVHLHRNSFELTNVHGKPTAGVLKDVVLVKGFRKIEADFTPAMTA